MGPALGGMQPALAQASLPQQQAVDPALLPLPPMRASQGQAADQDQIPIDSPSAQINDRVLKLKGQILVEELSSGGAMRSGQQDPEVPGSTKAPITLGEAQRTKARFTRQAQISPDSSQGLTSVVQASDGLSNIYYKRDVSAG